MILAIATQAACADPAPDEMPWRLSTHPHLQLGSRQGDSSQTFGRLAGAVRLTSGVIAVADQMTNDVLFFSSEGDLVQAAGGRGEGPGEFRTIMSMRRCGGDSVFVYDPAHSRLTIYDSLGEFVGTEPVLRPAGDAPPYDFFCSERTLAFVHRSPAPPAGIGPRRPRVAISLVRIGGGDPVDLGTFPASERYFDGSNDFPRPLGKETSVAVGREALYVGTGDYRSSDGDHFEVSSFSTAGEPLPTLVASEPRVEVKRRHIDTYLDDRFERRSGPRRTAFRRRLERIQYPHVFPPHGRILVDPLENLWVEEYPRPGTSVRQWRVFATGGGEKIGGLQVPGSFTLTQIGSRHVVGLHRDRMGVEFVRVYELIKDVAAGTL